MFLADADWIQILAALLFFGITGLAQWLQKRYRERGGLPSGTPADSSAPTAIPPPLVRQRGEGKRSNDWEEQLRQLLGGEPVPPPPVPDQEGALPPRRAPVRDEEFSWETEEPDHRPLASFPGTQRTARTGERIDAATTSQLARASRFQRTTRALGQASELEQTIAERLQVARDRTESIRPPATAVSSRPSSSSAPVRSAEIIAVVTQLRRPATARQAILASMLLLPPKSLQE